MQTDYVQRFMFENLDIRGRLVCLTGAWQRMLDGRGYPEDIVSLLGHTTALNTLLGANQKGAGRVTLQVQGSGPVKLLVADCTAELRIRGMASYEKVDVSQESERSLLGNGRLSVTLEDLKSGQFYQSLVPLEGETLEQIFTHYLSQSEQLPAHLRLFADGGALAGLLLEKLPNADSRDPDGWNRVIHFANALTLDETKDAQPYDLLTKVFPEELMRVFRLYAVEYHCPYDEDKVRDMLRGLGRQEVESILAEQGEVVIRNEMCNHEYRFDAAAVARLFATH
ncbi:MAG: Hsp33 family molecular chaperone HslO [Betaproteobacteria bacterium]|nr:Hsp33 family molecular chaperone HslO [Betaproteobacteria bacterium]MBV9360211.1 Hsp33 family molecular chaperone HslO [Betaproteobacteria bacterium]